MRHRSPFHRSARVCGGKLEVPPAAVQADSEVQDTLLKKSPCVPGGLGVGSTVQVVPLSRSARVPALVLPAAMQAVADWHQTAPRKAPCVRWVDVCWTVQLVPFHRSAKVPAGPEGPNEVPTAMQAADPGHATPVRPFCGWPAGVGVGTILQVLPFHRSAKVTSAPELFT